MFRSLKTSPQPPEKQRISSEQYGKIAVLYKYEAYMRAVFKPHKGELPVGKKGRLLRANTSPDPSCFFRLRFPEQESQ